MRTSSTRVLLTARLLSAGLVLAVCSGGTPAWAQSKAGVAGTGGVRLRAIGADARGGRAAAIVVDEGALVHSALLYPVDAQGRLQGGSDAYAQATHVLGSLDTALRAAGTGLDRIARLHVYVAHASVTAAVDRLLAERFTGAAPAAVTIVESRMPRAGVLVAMDAVAATARRQPPG
ncbi:MAG: RidA family protein, partial [Acidobacteria bacterium]|nr:RidA family protein [Acidobacteriota bacterium]